MYALAQVCTPVILKIILYSASSLFITFVALVMWNQIFSGIKWLQMALKICQYSIFSLTLYYDKI